MKIGVTICEYNPFHNGHLYSLNKIKERLTPEAIVVIMSGNFTQRGEIALMHKYQRATHAILAGADLVIELPTPFATAPAEIFAKGAVKLLNELQGEKTLCFGVENEDKQALIQTAKALSCESEEYKTLLKELLKSGISPALAKQRALQRVYGNSIDLSFTESPNNILALEYVKAIIQNGYGMNVLPILRVGSGYKDLDKNQFSSAMAIRSFIEENRLLECENLVPEYVFKDLPKNLPSCDEQIMQALLTISKEDLAKVTDCTEGLENKLKTLAKECFTRKELIDKAVNKRYTRARISRITLGALLQNDSSFTFECLKQNLYLKVLAIKKEKLSLLSSLNPTSPFIMRKSDVNKLSPFAQKLFEKEILANDIYNQITKTKTNEFETKII